VTYLLGSLLVATVAALARRAGRRHRIYDTEPLYRAYGPTRIRYFCSCGGEYVVDHRVGGGATVASSSCARVEPGP
jgi:hypothetical protein